NQIRKYSADKDEEKNKQYEMKALSRKIGSAHRQNKHQHRDHKRRSVTEIAGSLPSAIRDQHHRSGDHQRWAAGDYRLQNVAVGEGDAERGGLEVEPVRMHHSLPAQFRFKKVTRK